MRMVCTMVPIAIAAGAALAGCVDGIEFDFPPPQPITDCVEASVRSAETATISGVVRDHVTAEPIAGADVAFTTAWDVPREFPPPECEPLATFTTSGEGGFGPQAIEVGSHLWPPIVLFTVTGEGLADTTSDQTLSCEADDCGTLDHAIAAPARRLADSWRQELERGGMPDASSRGLVLFEFREPDGAPAEGVVPWALHGEVRDVLPDVEVRFLEPDRVTLAPLGTAATTASGIALIGLDGRIEGETAQYVFGERGDDLWQLTGVLDPPGWIFVEDLRLTR